MGAYPVRKGLVPQPYRLLDDVFVRTNDAISGGSQDPLEISQPNISVRAAHDRIDPVSPVIGVRIGDSVCRDQCQATGPCDIYINRHGAAAEGLTLEHDLP